METLSAQENIKTPDQKPTAKKWLGVFYIILSAFFFALMNVFVRLAGDLPTFQKAFFRNLVATLVAFIMLCKSRSFKPQKGNIPALLFRSIAGTVGIVCNFYAVDNLAVADASILGKLAPFFAIIFSALILKEKASARDWALVLLAFSGATLVVKPSLDITQSLPALVGVLGGLSAGLAYTFVHYLGGRGERKAVIVFYFSAFSCLAVLPMAIANFMPMTVMQVVFLLLAGVSASLAQFSVTSAYSYAPAKDISVYDFSQVLFSALWGLILFSELPDIWSFIGYIVIIGSAVLKYLLTHRAEKENQV